MRAAARAPVVVLLWTLALIAAASAAWTIGDAIDALRYALVIAGYGALATAAAVVARSPSGRMGIYATITLLAAVSGIVGLVGAGLQEAPYAQRTGGTWQAAGAFEYGPANALLQVTALPILLTAMAGRRRGLAVAAAGGAAIAGAVIGLSSSFFAEVACATVLALAVAFPGPTLRRPRTVALAGALLVVATALGAHLAAGRFAPPCEFGGDGARLTALAAVPIAAAAIWALARRSLTADRASLLAPGCALAAAAALAIGGALVDPEGTCTAPTRGVEPYAGLLHGRVVLWEAAFDVALDHPLGGSGADTYGIASVAYQEGDQVLYAHNLPLELWAELGPAGAVLALALYVAVAVAVVRARMSAALWLAGVGVVAFSLSNLVDFPWHLAGAGAVWALGLGVVIAADRSRGGHERPRGILRP